MSTYIALLRGIGPANPNMRNEKLRGVFEDLGFKNVQTVISSGNVLFESASKKTQAMETKLEKSWPEKLGFTSTTTIRSQKEIQQLVKQNPFGGMKHGPKNYLLTTFLKNKTEIDLKFPYRIEDKSFTIVGATDREIFCVTDTTAVKTPDVMRWLEKQFGKEISSRTWKTVKRIATKMEQSG